MDKGIRPFVNAKFATELATRVNTREGNTLFRKNVMHAAMEAFGITLASAATHYNHAFIEARKAAVTDPALAPLLEGLGRPEDKKGGRKPKQQPAALATPSVIPVPAATLLQSFLNAPVRTAQEAAAAVLGQTAQAAPLEVAPVAFIDTQMGIEQYTADAEQVLFTVRKKSDDSVVAEGVSLEDAQKLVQAAREAKKAKLYWS